MQAVFKHGPGRGVRRTALHRSLHAALFEAGVHVEHRAVRVVTDGGDHVLVDGERVRHLVAADGLHSPVRRMLGLDGPVENHRRFGQRSHGGSRAVVELIVEVHWSACGEAYVTPVAAGLVGVRGADRPAGVRSPTCWRRSPRSRPVSQA